MTIIRAKREHDFSIISNKVYDKNQLSWQAMGLLGYLLTKPDNWKVMVAELVNVTKDTKKPTGKEGVYNIIKELRDKGFIVVKKNSDGSTDYKVFDEPNQAEPNQAEPNQAEPNQAEPNQAEPTLINTEYKQVLKYTNTPLPPNGENEKDDLNADAPITADHSENGERAATAKKPTKHEADLALLSEHGITGQIAEDFLTIRKAKRQPLTETAMRLIAADAEKCGMTAAQAVEYAIGNGWGSFRAEWLKNKTFGRSGNRGGLTHNQTADVMDGKNYGDAPTTDF